MTLKRGLLILYVFVQWRAEVEAFTAPSSSLKGARLPETTLSEKGGFFNLKNPFSDIITTPSSSESLFVSSSEPFDPSPDGLIRQAMRVVATDFGLLEPSLLDDLQFEWLGPYVDKPLDKTDYLAAGRFFDIRKAFPDLNYRAHDFRIDEDNVAKVRFTCRTTGTMRGELRLRGDILAPTGKVMRCPPEAVTVIFDLDTGNVLRLTQGFPLDRLVGNTGGTTGVVAAAKIGGKPISDWEIYAPLTVLKRFFGRPDDPIPEATNYLAPFPGTVMIQLAKGVLLSNLATEDPTLLSNKFTFATPSAGPIRKRDFLEKFASEEFKDVIPNFSNFRVDPYDPSRVWVDLKPTGIGYEGCPQAMSLAFDEDGYCTRMTSGAVIDPDAGNGGGLGGPAGYKFATTAGGAFGELASRPLPRILGRIKNDAFGLVGGSRRQARSVSAPPVPKRPPIPTVVKATSQRLPSPEREKLSAPLQKLTESFGTINLLEMKREAEALKEKRDIAQAEQAGRAARALDQLKETVSGSINLLKLKAMDKEDKAEQAGRAARALDQLKETVSGSINLLKLKATEDEDPRVEAEKRRGAAARAAQEKQREALARKKRQEAAAARESKERQLAQQIRDRQMQAQRDAGRVRVQQEQARIKAEQAKQVQEQRAAERAQAQARKAEQASNKKAQAEARKAQQARIQQEKEAASRVRATELQQQKAKALQERQAKATAAKLQAQSQQAEKTKKLRELAAAQKRAKAKELQAMREKQAAAQARAKMKQRQRAIQLKEQRAATEEAQKATREREIEERKRSAEALREQRVAALAAAKQEKAAATEAQKAARAKQAAQARAQQEAAKRAEAVRKQREANQRKRESEVMKDLAKQRTQEKAALDSLATAPPRATIRLFGFGNDDDDEPVAPSKSTKGRRAPFGVPTLSRWRKNLDGSVSGLISGSKNFDEGERVTTSRIAKGTIAGGEIVTTGSGSRYFLAGSLTTVPRKQKQQEKAALDSLSNAPPRATLRLFGLGNADDDESLPAPKPAVKGRKAPFGTPTLSRWRKNRNGSITGLISGSRSFDDGERITTSNIAKGTIASGEVVTTGSGSRYFLD